MEKNEIRKELYREGTMAKKVLTTGIITDDIESVNESHVYVATLLDGTSVMFKVPILEMGETKFNDEEPAKLLWRWFLSDDKNVLG